MNCGNCIGDKGIERAVLKVSKEIENSWENSKKSWGVYTEGQLWFELVSCILGSRVKYELAKGYAKHLNKRKLLNIRLILKNHKKIQKKIYMEMSKPLHLLTNGKFKSKYPYPKIKSFFIIKTCLELYKKPNKGIISLLKKCNDEYEARHILIKKCAGIGPKQASLFLRNISYCDNLAILDSHVINYMGIRGLIKHKKKNITMREYFIYEEILFSYAESLNKKLSYLDFAIWIVMRVIRRNF